MATARSSSDRRAALQAVGLGRLEPPVTPVHLSELGNGSLVALLQPLARISESRGAGPIDGVRADSVSNGDRGSLGGETPASAGTSARSGVLAGDSGGDPGGGLGGAFGSGYVAIVREASELGLLAEEVEASLAERGIPVRARCAS